MKPASLLIFLSIFFSTVYSAIAYENITVFTPEDNIVFDSVPHIIYDTAFEESFVELSDMFIGKIPYSLKRAEFLVENAFFGGDMDYDKFCHDIDSIAQKLNNFLVERNIRQYRTSPNFALFLFFTEPSELNGYKAFSYDFDNPLGDKGFFVTFASNLLKTHKGQCTSMPLLYKIICDEMGGRSRLAFAPYHLYVKHIGEDGRWVNVELTHGGFVRDVWLMETLNASTESIRHGTFLCALSDDENIALLIMHLAKAYNSKYAESAYDYFTERCANTVLEKLPNFCDAIMMQVCMIQHRRRHFRKRYGSRPCDYLEKAHKMEWALIDKLDSLGYTQLKVDEYEKGMDEARRWYENQQNNK